MIKIMDYQRLIMLSKRVIFFFVYIHVIHFELIKKVLRSDSFFGNEIIEAKNYNRRVKYKVV